MLWKSTSLVRGLRKPLKEELIGLFSVPGIPEEFDFNEANSIIGELQKSSSMNWLRFLRIHQREIL